MNQKSKPAIINLLFILCFSQFSFAYAQNLSYSWIGGASTNFSDLNNWEENSSFLPPNDFVQAGDVFDFGAASGLASTFDLKGMTIGEITIKKSGGGSVTLENTGTLTISSTSLPVFGIGISVDFSKSGSNIVYTAQPSGSNAEILTQYTHNNLELNWNTAINASCSINGNVNLKPNYNLSVNAPMTVGGNLNAFAGTVTIGASTTIGGILDAFSGSLVVNSSGSLVVSNNTNAFTGNITSSGSITFNGSVGNFSGSITTSGPLNFNGSTGNFSGNITANSSNGIIKFANTLGQFSSIITVNTSAELQLLATVNSFSGSIINYSNLTLGASCLMNSGITGTVTLIEGGILDSRATKSFPGTWIYSIKPASTLSSAIQYVYPGTYNKLDIRCVARLAGNTAVSNELILNNYSSNNRLELYGYTLTISGIVKTGSTNYLRSASTAIGNLVINSSATNVGTLYFTGTLLKNFTISNGATVTLGNALNIVGGASFGTVTVESNSTLNTGGTNGFLTLQSTSTGSARIGESNGVINGQYTVQTYIPATGRKYRFLASPVVNGTATQWRNNGSSSTTASIGIQITGSGGSGSGFDNSTTNNPSAFWYDETIAGNDTAVGSGSSNDAGWTALTSGNQTLDNGKGYRVLVRGDRTISLTSTTPGTINPTTIWVKGIYPGYSASSSSSQPVVVNVTKTSTNRNSGINLIGNPYPSTIDWNSVTRSANVDAAYITYDPGVSGKGWSAASRYRGWNGSTGGAGRYIAAGQGFMVYTTGSGTVTFEENDKVTNAAGNFFTEKLTNHIIITMAYDSAYLDEAYLHFRDDASNFKDQYDLVQMINPTVNVATLDSNGQSYNINSLGKLEGKRVVPINLNNNPASDYKFKFNDLGTFANHRVYLNDKFTSQIFEVFEGNEYPISITSDPISSGTNRLELVFEPIAADLKRIADNNAISIFSNPVKDVLQLQKSKAHNIGVANIEIYNTNGQLVLHSKWGEQTEISQINTSKLTQGIYFATIKSKNYSQTIKFSKN